MDERFLQDARRDPKPEFAERLHESLKAQGAARPSWRPAWSGFRLAPVVSVAVTVVAMVLLFTLPSVRASAQAFLDLFRVRNFAAVPVDEARIQQLQGGNIDVKGLLGDHVETLKEPGKPTLYSDPAAAGAAAGFAARVPATLPYGLTADTIAVTGEGEARVTVVTAKLREVLTTLGINDVTIPDQLDGAKVTVKMPHAVMIHYRSDTRRVGLIQAHSPEVQLPQGLDLARLGEIGLRVVGLGASDAHRFAQSIDWHSTVLVPVPANVSSFREVSVHGVKGLLITTSREIKSGEHRHRPGTLLMWSEGDMVYALQGNIDDLSLMQMANSMR
jgi:hypothetical protein